MIELSRKRRKLRRNWPKLTTPPSIQGSSMIRCSINTTKFVVLNLNLNIINIQSLTSLIIMAQQGPLSWTPQPKPSSITPSQYWTMINHCPLSHHSPHLLSNLKIKTQTWLLKTLSFTSLMSLSPQIPPANQVWVTRSYLWAQLGTSWKKSRKLLKVCHFFFINNLQTLISYVFFNAGDSSQNGNPAGNSEQQQFEDIIKQRISRIDEKGDGGGGAGKNKFTYQISQYDLTGYMLHILMKVSEILYLSVCQIPTPIRSFIKIFADSLLSREPNMQKEDLYRILNELVVDRWLSVSF